MKPNVGISSDPASARNLPLNSPSPSHQQTDETQHGKLGFIGLLVGWGKGEFKESWVSSVCWWDEEGEFKGRFQALAESLGISIETNPPCIPRISMAYCVLLS